MDAGCTKHTTVMLVRDLHPHSCFWLGLGNKSTLIVVWFNKQKVNSDLRHSMFISI